MKLLPNGLPSTCKGCPLCANKQAGYFSKISGKGTTGVLIVGEASGEQEAQEARPFIEWAQSGSILEKCIRNSGLSREDFFLTNIVRCRPPNNYLQGASYEREAIQHCSQYLNNAIRDLQPRAILALGGIPTRELTGFSGGKRSIAHVRGYPLTGPGGITVIPSYHPSFIVRGNTHLIPILMKDIASARSAAAGRLQPVLNPSELMEVLEGIKAFEMLYEEAKNNPDLWIAYDIETKESLEGTEDELVEFDYSDDTDAGGDSTEDAYGSGSLEHRGEIPDRLHGEASYQRRNGPYHKLDFNASHIISIQFAISDVWGIYGDWTDSRIRALAQLILNLPNPKVAHNGDHFDRPKLELEGVRILGDHYDSLSIRKALQPDLPAGLQQVAVDYGWLWPWKHFSGSDAVLYGVADVCSLIRIIYKLPHELVRLGMWEGYEKLIRSHRAKVEIPWERRGIPMDVPRLDEFREWLTDEVGQKLNCMLKIVPEELHSKHPEEGYANLPPALKEEVLAIPQVQRLMSPTLKKFKNGNERLIQSKYKNQDIYKMLVNNELAVGYDGVPRVVLPDLMEKYGLRRGVFNGQLRLYEHVPFNPRSSQQMIKYLKFKGYEVPKDFKTEKETTADKLMKRLEVKHKDPVIGFSREIRAYEKMKDSYTGKVGPDGVARGGWVPDEDGRLRTRAMTNSTWQFSSLNPNVFTLPKRREELAKRFRRAVAAEPGHVMIEFDFKSFHDLMTASLATDEAKWRTARLDPHAFVAGWLVRYPGIETSLSLSDPDLKLYLKEIRSKHEKVRNEQAKPLNHGINFGEGPKRLYVEYEEYFESELQAKQMHELMRRVYPKTFLWQDQLLASLEIKGGRAPYLQSVWGARRWFWDVWSWKLSKNGRWYKAKGQDAEKALAFLPSNHAHGMFRLKMLEMSELGWLERYQLINFPHDALVFHPLLEDADRCIADVKEWMEAPVIELANPILCPNGLSCAVDVQIGPDLGTMKEIH